MNDKIIALFETIFDKMLGWFIGPFRGNLDSLNTLIYKNEDLYYGIFDEKQFGVVAQGMAVMQSISVGIILISIIMAGMRVSSAGINPANRTSAIEYFKDFVIVALLFFNLSTIYGLIFDVNSMFVSAFSSAKDIIGGDLMDKAGNFMEKGPLGGLVIGLIMLGLWIWANFYYMMRTLTLMLLTIMGPLMVSLYLFPQTKGITVGYFKEYTGTVFVQSIHAALYWIIASVASEDFGLGSVLLYMIFIPVSESIRSLLGLGGQMNDKLSKSAAMFGGAALAGVAGSIKGAMNGQSVTAALRGAAGQVSDKMKGKAGTGDGEEGPKSLLGGAGTDIGSTSRAERMLKAGEIFSKGGKAVFGAAGAIAGSPMGPMGSITGSTAGFIGGGVIGGVAGRAGMAGAEFVGNRLKDGTLAGWKKGKGIMNADAHADEKTAAALAEDETTNWANQHKDDFMKENKKNFPDITDDAREQMWNDRVATKRSEHMEKARATVGNLKSMNGKYADGNELASATTENLTNNWAKNNKDQFMRDYETSNPLPSNATEGDIQKHNQNKNQAWQQAVEGKKKQFGDIANNAVKSLGAGNSLVGNYVNKDDFSKQVGKEVAALNGTGEREGIQSVNAATDSVKGASIYSHKKVNMDMIQNHIASVRTASGKTDFIKDAMEKGASEDDALKQWNTQQPKAFERNLNDIKQSTPQEIKLDHMRIGSKTGRFIAAGASAIGTGIATGSGIPQAIQQTSSFIGDTKLGHGVKAAGLAIQSSWANKEVYQNPVTAGVSAIGSGIKLGFKEGMAHTADNVIGKQVAFKDMVAYSTGIVGGVAGYKAGAKWAGGGTSNTKAFGLKGFNPYNSAVNNQVSEIAEIEQMVQTVEGQIPTGALRMVTTKDHTIIQATDKTGRVQTVSRVASGDSGLNKGQTLYQDLTIQEGQFATASNVYQEDSAGGRITSTKTINVNPNKIIANRNSSGNPRVVKDVQSYNQLVDSGQYYLADAMKDMSEIRMVVDRNRSYLVGSKEGQQYRISQYGPGDTRLDGNQVVERNLSQRNNKLVVEPSESYTSSLKPEDLAPYRPPNKRSAMRKQNESFRVKSFTGSLR